MHDIERMQGLISRMATMKGNIQDELRRNKEKSRKTQAFLSETKKVQSSSIKANDMTGTSPEKSMKQTMMSGGATSSTGMSNSQRSLIVELLLFGPQAMAKRGGINLTTSSFAGTISSGNTTGVVSPVYGLKYIIKSCPITTFEISMSNADGTRRTDS